MMTAVRIVLVVMLVGWSVGSVIGQQPATTSKTPQTGADYFFKTPGSSDALQIARIYADPKGETHFEFINLLVGPRPKVTGGVFNTYPPPPSGPSPLAPLARVGLPLRPNANVGFTMISGDAVVAALHPLARSYFIVLTGTGFSWKATDGTEVNARPGGPIFLADDQDSKGHITRGLGLDSVFMSIPLTGDSPRRPCANAPVVLDCLMGK
jgi:hypothetical protein